MPIEAVRRDADPALAGGQDDREGRSGAVDTRRCERFEGAGASCCDAGTAVVGDHAGGSGPAGASGRIQGAHGRLEANNGRLALFHRAASYLRLMPTIPRHYRAGAPSQAVVEFGIIILLLLLIVGAATDLGLFLAARLTLIA